MSGRCATSLLLRAGLLLAPALSFRSQQDVRLNVTGDTCTELKNMGSHFTVKVGVGTPPQWFTPVADTGSSYVIIPSCICAAAGTCNPADDCFQGTDKSSTFTGPEGKTVVFKMTFGSGDIYVAIASDTVQMGDPPLKHQMHKGLLLMVKRELQIAGPFEGIMGLGLPGDRMTVKRPGSDGPNLLGQGHFLQEAGTQRFSICFNDNKKPGILLFDPPPAAKPMKQMSESHWGLDLRKFSVNGVSSGLQPCNGAGPCTAVVDSGTTLIMGPELKISFLFAELCGNWPRCKNRVSTSQEPPARAFQELLFECKDWMGMGGLTELPSLSFTVAGADGAVQELDLSGWGYVTETSVADVMSASQLLPGNYSNLAMSFAKQFGKVCIPSFGAVHWDSSGGMPTWILGSPLFYEHRVVFGLGPPATIGFEKGGCPGSCATRHTALVAASSSMAKAPRQLNGVRMPWPRGELN